MKPNYEISGACGLARFAKANRDEGQASVCVGLLGGRFLINVPTGKYEHCWMYPKCTGKLFCSLNAQVDSVSFDGRDRRLRNVGN